MERFLPRLLMCERPRWLGVHRRLASDYANRLSNSQDIRWPHVILLCPSLMPRLTDPRIPTLTGRIPSWDRRVVSINNIVVALAGRRLNFVSRVRPRETSQTADSPPPYPPQHQLHCRFDASINWFFVCLFYFSLFVRMLVSSRAHLCWGFARQASERDAASSSSPSQSIPGVPALQREPRHEKNSDREQRARTKPSNSNSNHSPKRSFNSSSAHGSGLTMSASFGPQMPRAGLWKKGESLGCGAFGAVFLGLNSETGTERGGCRRRCCAVAQFVA